MVAGCNPSDPPPRSGSTSASGSRSSSTPDRPTPRSTPALPRGGHSLFPHQRIVAFYGANGTPALGVLGQGSPDDIWPRLARQAHHYARPHRPVLPAYELIAAVASSRPGPAGKYRTPVEPAVIDRYLASARRHHALLILDIQPGQADFLAEAKRLTRWLKQPDVALALDPEWNMGPGDRPGKQIGSMSAAEINRVSRWLDDLTASHRLPEKLLLIHQFTPDMIHGKRHVHQRPHLALTFNMDGFGTPQNKKSRYQALTRDARFAPGFKLFYQQDQPLLTPQQVLRLDPPPNVVEYQ